MTGEGACFPLEEWKMAFIQVSAFFEVWSHDLGSTNKTYFINNI